MDGRPPAPTPSDGHGLRPATPLLQTADRRDRDIRKIEAFLKASSDAACILATESRRLNRIAWAEEEGVKVLDAALAEQDGQSGRFARRLSGSTELGTRRNLQNAANRQHRWPMVLVAQSRVGREGLNLHKSCRTIVLDQPE